jgi:hypothetical protein
MPAITVILLLCGGVFFTRHLLAEPRVVLLESRDGADWLRVDRPFDSGANFDPLTAVAFSTSVEIPEHFAGAVMRVDALRRVIVDLDDRSIFDSGPELAGWKHTREVSIPPGLKAGRHSLIFVVSNRDGPSMLRAVCPELKLRSGADWLATADGKRWTPAVPADRVWEAHLPPQFVSTRRAMWELSPIFLIVFFLGAGLLGRRASVVDWGRRMRWFLLLAWVVMAVNNVSKVPLTFGFDVDEHMRFIQYVANHHTLPRPDGAWQFFQAPLYYLVSGAMDRLLRMAHLPIRAIPYALRAIPLLCGGLMMEWCYRAGRILFPNRFDLQAVTTAVGGLLPVNIYMAMAVSNEPAAAAMSGLVVLMSLKLLSSPSVPGNRRLMAVGFFWGLAFLTKINAVLWAAPMGFAIVVVLVRQRSRWFEFVRAFACVGGTGLLVSNWWLIRNMRQIGRPFYLESTMSVGQWWQLPGYRTPKMFYEFGRVFHQPIYNGLASVWDSLYGTLWGDGIVGGHPGWNFRLMSAGLGLAVVPMLLIATGIFRAIFSSPGGVSAQRDGLRFASLSIGCFLLAILYVFLTLPIYSCAKASYLLGTAPCIGLLAAAGFDQLSKHRKLRAVIGGMLICWAATAYLTFFVIG